MKDFRHCRAQTTIFEAVNISAAHVANQTGEETGASTPNPAPSQNTRLGAVKGAGGEAVCRLIWTVATNLHAPDQAMISATRLGT